MYVCIRVRIREQYAYRSHSLCPSFPALVELVYRPLLIRVPIRQPDTSKPAEDAKRDTPKTESD